MSAVDVLLNIWFIKEFVLNRNCLQPFFISCKEVGEEDMQGFQQQTTCSSMAEKDVLIPGRRRTPEKSFLIKGQWTPDEDE